MKIVTSITKNDNFCMLWKLICSQRKIGCYKYKTFYGNQKGKTCSRYIKDYDKGVKEYHHKKSSTQKERQQERKQRKRDLQNRKQQNGNSNSLSINNYFLCKWIKFSNPNTENG